jgi:preprotein translocase subunit SecF
MVEMENYKKLMFFPIIFLLLSIVIIINNLFTTGEILHRGVELTGGITITIPLKQKVNITEISSKLPGVLIREITGNQKAIIIQSSSLNETQILNTVKKYIDFNEDEIEVGKIEPVLGDIFWQQSKIAIIFAGVLIIFIIFFLFRSVFPCLAVLLALTSNFIETIAILSLLRVELTIPVIGALLMMLGYSIDTNVLLTTSVIKKRGNPDINIKNARKTGLTVSLASIISLIIIYLLSQNYTIQTMSLVLCIGLITDIINTWVQNAGILRLLVEKRRK